MSADANQILKKISQDIAGRAVFEKYLNECDEGQKRRIMEGLLYQGSDEESSINEELILSAMTVLKTEWPEPRWAIREILPVGLTNLAGQAKIGKSWFALQMAEAVSTGGCVLGRQADKGKALYLALEDSPERMKGRMRIQGWSEAANCDFIVMKHFQQAVGYLDEKGVQKLDQLMANRGYTFVIIDTLARAVVGDQNDVAVMTQKLSPLQELAHEYNSVILMLDHHNKNVPKNGEFDVIRNILGSTAKGAVSDTVIGLYKNQGVVEGRLAMTGKDVEEKIIHVRWDKRSGKWEQSEITEEDDEEGLSQQELEIINVMENLKGVVGASMIAEQVGRNRGAITKQLERLREKGKVRRSGSQWELREEVGGS